MANIQFDYSTLSTEIDPSLIADLIENSYDSDEDEEDQPKSESIVEKTESVGSEPPDKCKLVYITFGLIGMGTLLPWNFFITAYDYWMYKFGDVHNATNVYSTQKTKLQTLFASYLALANNVPFVFFLVISPVFNDRIPHLYRIAGSLFATIILFLVFTSLVEVDTDSWQMPFFSLTMFLVVLVSVASAVFQSGATGVVSVLPPRYIHVLVLGQAGAGIFASVAQIISLLGHQDSVRSALAYFLCADITLVITLLSYFATQRSDFFQFYFNKRSDVTSLKNMSQPEVPKKTPVLLVLKLVWPYAISVMLVFWVTIAVFPGITVLVASENVGHNTLITGKLFLPVACFLLFNVSDFCGRIAGGWLTVPFSWKFYLLCVCILRVVFIPLFMLCNAHPRSHLPIVFPGDAAYIAFITLLGLTNGYLVTVAMINGAKSLNPSLQEMSGVILSAFLGAGLMLGSVSSYIFVQLL